MKLAVREVPYDLYAIMVLSTLLVISIVTMPGLTVPRVVLGLPFLLFYPGYVLICALYPERKLYYDSEGRKLPGRPDEQDGQEEVEGEVDDGKPSDEARKSTGKGLDGLERVALSLGLSIAVTPLIGLVLNWTYDWDPQHLGIRLWLVLTSIYLFNIIGAGIAAYRRSRVPLEDRFVIELDISLPKDPSPMDRFLTVGIVVMMVLSVSLLVYIIVVPRQGEAFTEFYVLGPSRMADGYPSHFVLEDEQSIFVGIGNHERSDRNYTIVLSISPEAGNLTVSSLDAVRVSKALRPALDVRVGKGRTLVLPCNFTVEDMGHHKLRLLLFLDGKEYRDLHLWVRVFERGQLAVQAENGVGLFVAGEKGDPAGLGTLGPGGGPTIVTIGIIAPSGTGLVANVTLHLDGQHRAVPFPSNGPADIAPGSGAYLVIDARAGTTTVTPDLQLNIYTGGGSGELFIDMRTEYGTLTASYRMVPDI